MDEIVFPVLGIGAMLLALLTLGMWCFETEPEPIQNDTLRKAFHAAIVQHSGDRDVPEEWLGMLTYCEQQGWEKSARHIMFAMTLESLDA